MPTLTFTFQQNELVSRCWSSPLPLHCGPVLLILSFVLGKHYWCGHNRITKHARTSWQHMASGETVWARKGVESSPQGMGCEYRSWLGLGQLGCSRPDVSYQGEVQEAINTKKSSMKAEARVYHSLRRSRQGCEQQNTALCILYLIQPSVLNKTSESWSKRPGFKRVSQIYRKPGCKAEWAETEGVEVKVEAQNWTNMEWEA